MNSRSVPPPTNAEIAQRAQELKVMYLGLMLTLPSMLDPTFPVLRTELARAGVAPDGDLPFHLYHSASDDKESLVYSVREILMKVAMLRGDILGKDLLSISMLLGGTRIGDMISQRGRYPDDVPLLQFARHFRNACAHGDRWNFRNNEPKYPAACRDVVVTRALQDQRATLETVSPRRYVEFLDDISNHFVPGSVPPPGRET